ncbi:MAG TPA: hypothetical protein PLO84_10525 [Thermotogota bacterium]|nr:hypothetical protein [Thermotogota bacterium]
MTKEAFSAYKDKFVRRLRHSSDESYQRRRLKPISPSVPGCPKRLERFYYWKNLMN